MKLHTLSKYQKLILGLIFDAMGLLPFLDLIWAPLSGYLMTLMYKGNVGKVAGVVSFLEEISPGLDVIPTFTVMWLYTYAIKKQDKEPIKDEE